MTPISIPALTQPSIQRQSEKAARLVSFGTALPPLRATQAEVLEFILANFELKNQTKSLYKRVLQNPSVRTRHFALDGLKEVMVTDRDKINSRFESWSVKLGAEALGRALAGAGLRPAELGFLAVTTCTGYICPGISAHLVESVGLRPDIKTVDIVGMGCGAAIPAIEQANNFLSAHPKAKAAVLSVEICSAAMYSDDAADLVISNALFGDGAAAVVLQANDERSDGLSNDSSHPSFQDFASLTIPPWRDTLRFKTQNGYLRNVLGKDVPRQAADALETVTRKLLARHGLIPSDIDHWIVHAGGEKILDMVQEKFSLPPDALQSSRNVLRDYGNLSSPTVLFVLQEEMRQPAAARGRPSLSDGTPSKWGLMASFGAGFSAHVALIKF